MVAKSQIHLRKKRVQTLKMSSPDIITMCAWSVTSKLDIQSAENTHDCRDSGETLIFSMQPYVFCL